MNHQQITKILGDAGFVAQVMTKRLRRPGYQVVQAGGAVGVLAGPYSVSAITALLSSRGFRVYQKPNTASDALFVGAA